MRHNPVVAQVPVLRCIPPKPGIPSSGRWTSRSQCMRPTTARPSSCPGTWLAASTPPIRYGCCAATRATAPHHTTPHHQSHHPQPTRVILTPPQSHLDTTTLNLHTWSLPMLPGERGGIITACLMALESAAETSSGFSDPTKKPTPSTDPLVWSSTSTSLKHTQTPHRQHTRAQRTSRSTR